MKKIYLLMYASMACILLFSIYFFNRSENGGAKHTLLVQAVVDSKTLTLVREEIAPLINEIIKEKLGLSQDDKTDFFSAKKINRLTLYYIKNSYEKGDSIIYSNLEKNENDYKIKPKATTIAPDVEFFGGPFGDKDELVIMINDPEKELSYLNQTMKKATHTANTEYKELHNCDLYDIKLSEQYPFLPHIGLGRIRSNLIKEYVKNTEQFDDIFKDIQTHIKKVVDDVVKKYLSKDDKLSIEKIAILDVKKQEYVKTL